MTSLRADPLVQSGHPAASGQGQHIGGWAAALARRGHEVSVYARRHSPNGPERVILEDGFEVRYLDAGPPAALPPDPTSVLPDFAGALADAWTPAPPDIVHTHYWLGALAGLAAARGTEVRTVHTFHSLASARTPGALDQRRFRLERAIARAVDHVVATTAAEVAELGRLAVRRRNISLIPPGVDIARFTDKGTSEPKRGVPRVVALGRLIPRKGFDVLLRAVAMLPDVEVVVAGAAEPDEPGESQRLQAVATSVGVGDRVVFRGAVAYDDLPALLRSADVVVCPGRYDPVGLVAVEAMACGVPVIATASGGHPDTVVDGVTGLLVPAGDPVRMGLALRRLLSDSHARLTMSRAAVDRARSRYSWDRIGEETERLYEAVCGIEELDAPELMPVDA